MKIFNLLSIAFLLGGAPILEVSGIGPSAFASLAMAESSKSNEIGEAQEARQYGEQPDFGDPANSVATISMD